MEVTGGGAGRVRGGLGESPVVGSLWQWLLGTPLGCNTVFSSPPPPTVKKDAARERWSSVMLSWLSLLPPPSLFPLLLGAGSISSSPYGEWTLVETNLSSCVAADRFLLRVMNVFEDIRVCFSLSLSFSFSLMDLDL